MKDTTKTSYSKSKKLTVAVIIAALVVAIGTIAVFAYLSGKSGTVKNDLVADPDPTISIVNPISGAAAVINSNDYSTYVRAAIVVTWVDNSDPTNVYANFPKAGVDYLITFSDYLITDVEAASDVKYNYWTHSTVDGFYYYSSPVLSGGKTNALYNSVEQLTTAPSGYHLNIQLAAQTIQSIGTTDVENSHAYSDGVLAVVDAWQVNTVDYTVATADVTDATTNGVSSDAKDTPVVLIYRGLGSAPTPTAAPTEEPSPSPTPSTKPIDGLPDDDEPDDNP